LTGFDSATRIEPIREATFLWFNEHYDRRSTVNSQLQALSVAKAMADRPTSRGNVQGPASNTEFLPEVQTRRYPKRRSAIHSTGWIYLDLVGFFGPRGWVGRTTATCDLTGRDKLFQLLCQRTTISILFAKAGADKVAMQHQCSTRGWAFKFLGKGKIQILKG
jgi:hypothetical protein